MVFEGEINVKCMVGRVISVKRNTLQSFIWGHNHLCGFHNHINSQSFVGPMSVHTAYQVWKPCPISLHLMGEISPTSCGGLPFPPLICVGGLEDA